MVIWIFEDLTQHYLQTAFTWLMVCHQYHTVFVPGKRMGWHISWLGLVMILKLAIFGWMVLLNSYYLLYFMTQLCHNMNKSTSMLSFPGKNGPQTKSLPDTPEAEEHAMFSGEQSLLQCTRKAATLIQFIEFLLVHWHRQN